jgi:hypothetical protein
MTEVKIKYHEYKIAEAKANIKFHEKRLKQLTKKKITKKGK